MSKEDKMVKEEERNRRIAALTSALETFKAKTGSAMSRTEALFYREIEKELEDLIGSQPKRPKKAPTKDTWRKPRHSDLLTAELKTYREHMEPEIGPINLVDFL